MKPFTDKEINNLTNWLDSQQDFIFLETTKVTEENCETFLFTRPRKWLVCTPNTKPEDFLQELESWRENGFFLAGWIGYEFGYLLEPSLNPLLLRQKRVQENSKLALMGVFERPIIYNHQKGKFTGITPDISHCYQDNEIFSINNLKTNIDRSEYFKALAKIKEYIKAGDTYQVNFTIKLLFSLLGSKAAFYKTLRKNQSVSYSAWIRYGDEDIMSFSPELFFKASKDAITVRPMKGTMTRGITLDDDKQYHEKLRKDPKNISENVMIVDLLRNDLARLLHATGGGTVKALSLFDIETYETLLQMTSTIIGSPLQKQQVELSETLKSLFPCGSVTGAPKIRTMEIIHELEKEQRGVYCGAIGYSSQKTTAFNVPIRTVVLNKNQGQMGIGSGIIHDSDPESEWHECLLKGRFLSDPPQEFQLIETILWQPDKGYWLLQNHLERLSKSADYFLFNYDLDEIITILDKTARTLQEQNTPVRVRLLLHRDSRVTIGATPLDGTFNPNHTTPCRITPLPTIVISGRQVEPSDPFLYHKTTRRKMYDNERGTALEKGHYEVIFLNIHEEVTEGSISNIFIRKKDRLLTPPVSSGLLAGTLRCFLLAQGLVLEKKLTRNDLVRAEEIYIGNSVRGLLQVRLKS